MKAWHIVPFHYLCNRNLSQKAKNSVWQTKHTLAKNSKVHDKTSLPGENLFFLKTT